MRILVVTPTYTENPTSGGVLVTHERIEALKKVGDVTVLCVDSDTPNPSGVTVVQAGFRRPRTAAVLLASYIHNLPLSVWRNTTPDLLAAAQRLAGAEWDMVYCDHWLVWEAAAKVSAATRVLHLHNAEHVLFERAAAHLPYAQALLAQGESVRVAKYLRTICAAADEVHFLSEQDQQILEASGLLGKTPSAVFLPACEFPEQVAPADSPVGLLTVGSLSWDPTRRGMSWFMQEVRPRAAEIALKVIGKGASAELAAALANDPACEPLGFVASLESHYQAAKGFIAPLLDGSGIKIKILNALARGLPVVTTSVGVEGFPEGFQDCVFVADDPVEFANAMRAIDAMPIPRWRTHSEAARHYAQQHFSGAAWQAWCGRQATR